MVLREHQEESWADEIKTKSAHRCRCSLDGGRARTGVDAAWMGFYVYDTGENEGDVLAGVRKQGGPDRAPRFRVRREEHQTSEESTGSGGGHEWGVKSYCTGVWPWGAKSYCWSSSKGAEASRVALRVLKLVVLP